MSVVEQSKKGRCDTCIYASRLTYPPGMGSPTDGVDCMNHDVALFQSEHGCDCLEEYEEYGNVNLWRVEVISDSTCEHWKGEGC